MKIRAGFLAGLALLLFAGLAPALPPGPNPPCAGAAIPDYPALGEAPNILLWTTHDLAPGWKSPSCTSWRDGAATIVVGLAGHFNDPGGADSLLARIGAIS